MDRSSAAKMTLLAQAGLGAGALALGGVLVTGLRTPPDPDVTSDIAAPVVELPADTTQASVVRVDGRGTANRFARVANSPKPVVVPVEPTETAPPPPVVQDTLTYHGMASMGSGSLGLLRINGRQKWVRVGDVVLGDEKTLEVAPEFVRVGAAEPGRRIDLATRAGGSVTLGVVSAAPAPIVDRGDQFLRDNQDFIAKNGGRLPPQFMARAQRATKDVPDYIADEDVSLFRKMRARALSDPAYQGQGDMNEIAVKLMAEERLRLEQAAEKGIPVDNEMMMTPQEQQAENAHLLKNGREGAPK